MIRYIITPYGRIPTFPLCVIAGVLMMLLTIHILLKKSESREKEEEFIYPKICLCLLAAFFSAALFDSFFKFLKSGIIRFGGITFYGGFIGAVAALYLQLKMRKSRLSTQYSIREWFDMLTPPLVVFHFFGRIGCFFVGCCYGKITDSFPGVVFPDNPELSVIHGGVRRYPTQLFEAGILLMIFVILIAVRHKFQIYTALYAAARFLLEYLRDDDRGRVTELLSPAQVIAIIMIVLLLLYYAGLFFDRKKDKVSQCDKSRSEL